MDDLVINERIVIPASELSANFSRSSGPGGQNVNKVNTKVDLRWQLQNSFALTETAKRRLRELAGSHLNKSGEIQFVCDENRDQISNLRSCRSRLKNLVIRALRRPKDRKPTRPTKSSIRRRLNEKKANSDKKQSRGNKGWE